MQLSVLLDYLSKGLPRDFRTLVICARFLHVCLTYILLQAALSYPRHAMPVHPAVCIASGARLPLFEICLPVCVDVYVCLLPVSLRQVPVR